MDRSSKKFHKIPKARRDWRRATLGRRATQDRPDRLPEATCTDEIYGRFARIMHKILDPESLRGTKYTKYLNVEKNFKRMNKQIQSLVREGHTYGIDFGCGVGFSLVLGKLYGIDIVGIDIAHYSGENPVYDHDGPSPFLTSQHRLKDLGYSVILRDTLEFPWTELKDDQFEFVMSFFSVTKNFGDKDNKWDWKRRLEELQRITKPAGDWYIGPKKHYNTVLRQIDYLSKIRLRMWGTQS